QSVQPRHAAAAAPRRRGAVSGSAPRSPEHHARAAAGASPGGARPVAGTRTRKAAAAPQSLHRPDLACVVRTELRMADFKARRVMVLAPHTDDGEFGCGATIARLLEEGSEVFSTAFSVCEQAVPYGFERDELERELMAATGMLGIPREYVITHHYEVRRFPEARQAVLQSILD